MSIASLDMFNILKIFLVNLLPFLAFDPLGCNISSLLGMKRKQVHLFKYSAATQLVVMGLDETLLNTYTGHARNSKSTNEYNVFAERLKDNELATKLSEIRGQVKCNPISDTKQR
ncbi:MAG: hypothetical protein EZS28_034044 [Streblomastix strix]|uniref:Uncharacterized protein n=1 Tax=Streblomastix strix TaxID=222440 RepID=A0A5J4UIM5_9EUKA|nr:MAG: hypothetical protein EZS28_034044 [Streblomastix strix]